MERSRPRVALILSIGLLLLASFSWAQNPPRREGGPPMGGRGPGGGPGRMGGPELGKEIQDPLLRRVLEAQGRLRYSGTRTVEFRQEGQRIRQTEYIVRDGLRQRTEVAPGSPNAGTIIIEDREQRLQFFPERNEIESSPSRLREGMQRLRMSFRGFQNGMVNLRREPGGRVAGLETTKLTFVDRRGNVLQTMWVDPNNGMILKRDLRDPLGASLGSFEFTRVNYEPRINNDDFKIDRRGAKIVSQRDRLFQMSRRLNIPPFRIPEEPGNPRLFSVRPIDLGGRRGIHQVYGFDEGRVSLFIFDEPLDRGRIQGLVRDRMNVLTVQRDGFQLIFLGEVEREELDRLARIVTK